MREVVITGIGVVSPIGNSKEQFWTSLCEGRSGVAVIPKFAAAGLPHPIGAVVVDFDARNHVRPRKNIKVMSRDIQMGFVAADLACIDAGYDAAGFAPERVGVVFGADLISAELEEMLDAYRACMIDGRFEFSRWGTEAMARLFPLWMLKYLPNMPACHVAIGRDARGPNDTVTLREVSSLAAIIEAASAIQRGQADAMIAGGASSQIHPALWARFKSYETSGRVDDPAAACRPFEAGRDGMVHGEGAAAFLLETFQHAQSRGAKIHARILGFASRFESRLNGRTPRGEGMRRAIRDALARAGLKPEEIGHVNADGVGTRLDDVLEARAIRDTLGDVPVTAPKSLFGNLAAAAGAVELVASLLALDKGLIPPTRNYERPDPECPVNVVHGQALAGALPTAMALNHDRRGRSVALVVAGR